MLGHPPEILLKLGTLSLRTYGVMLALAFWIGFWWADQRAKRRNLGRSAADIFFWAAVGALVGARLGFVVQNLSIYLHQPAEIFMIWQGGLSFHGGSIGGIATGWLALCRAGQLDKFWLFADSAAAPLLFGAALGRLGNWANQELYGYPTAQPWAIAIDPLHRLPGYENFISFHPTFAYEAVLNLLGVLLLIWRERTKIGNQPDKLPRFHFPFSRFHVSSGASFLFAIGWYGLARGITEIWRISDRILGPLSLAPLISLALMVIGFGGIRLLPKRGSHANE